MTLSESVHPRNKPRFCRSTFSILNLAATRNAGRGKACLHGFSQSKIRLQICLYVRIFVYMNIKDFQDTAEEVSGLMKLLSAPNRLMILCQLIESEKWVGELCRQLGMRSASMSQQLALLRQENVVSARRDGQTIFYSIVDEKQCG